MIRRTTFASLTGFVAGAALTFPLTALSGESMAGHLLPTLIRTTGVLFVLLIAGRVFSTWLKESHAVTCQELRAAAEQRTTFQKALEARAADLAQREARLAAAIATAEAQRNELQQALMQEAAHRVQLEADYDQLAEDYNLLVSGTLQQSATLFRPRETRAPLSGSAPLLPMPLPIRIKDATRQQIKDAKRHPQDATRHDRATSPLP
ncbi:hypothetical protein [Streptomyces sp. NE06-03C]|uniref:hypothetical protein n=1 Tax=Streptomyces sp. NE06-03C TaxID=3028694 RepID=UPI0029B86096|nr:hypothetical protein [Streptomyces sp. NE06-03C]MDX2919699.1 hypothetical protein [Streptomyces sp. NE06-03C]